LSGLFPLDKIGKFFFLDSTLDSRKKNFPILSSGNRPDKVNMYAVSNLQTVSLEGEI